MARARGHVGNLYYFSNVTPGTYATCEFDKPIKRIHIGADDLVVTNSSGIPMFRVKAGQEYEFPSIGGYPDKIYVTGSGDDMSDSSRIEFLVEEYGIDSNENYFAGVRE